MTTTELKIPVSCRVYPQLKSELEEEAQDEGLTTSMYLEKILNERHDSSEKEEEEVEFNNVYELEVEIEELKVEVEMLQEQVVKLEKENLKLTSKHEAVELKMRQLKLLPFEEEELDELESKLEELQELYPDKSFGQLLLASLHAALENEDSIFFIHTPKGYFEKSEV